MQDMYINCINKKLAYSIRKYQGKRVKARKMRDKAAI